MYETEIKFGEVARSSGTPCPRDEAGKLVRPTDEHVFKDGELGTSSPCLMRRRQSCVKRNKNLIFTRKQDTL